MPLGILGNVVFLVQHRHQFIHNHAGVFVVQRIVFRGPVGGAVAPLARVGLGLIGAPARVDEHTNHHRQFAPEDKVIHYVLRAHIAIRIHEGLAVVVNHETGRRRRVVLRGDINPISVLRAGIRVARQGEWPTDFAFRDAILRQRVRPKFVERIGVRRLDGGRLRQRGQRNRQRNCESYRQP